MRVGGPAAILVNADELTDLRLTMQTVKDYQLPFLVLGRGSNLLVSDTGFPGIAMRLGQSFKQLTVSDTELTVGAGVSLGKVVQTALRHSLGGMAFAVGIPGTIGAAVAVNAGAHDRDMSAITQKIVYYSRDLEMRTATGASLEFSYRSCQLPAGAVIIEVRLGLETVEPDAIKNEMERNWKRRKNSQPLDSPSAGSIFKNPEGHYAARLIEDAGLKGHQVGKAQVSTKHANFFINTGDASAADFHKLINKVRTVVRDSVGVELETEVRLVGDWSDV
jgi:UDP-N-acetylmuramate dehydrogenase